MSSRLCNMNFPKNSVHEDPTPPNVWSRNVERVLPFSSVIPYVHEPHGWFGPSRRRGRTRPGVSWASEEGGVDEGTEEAASPAFSSAVLLTPPAAEVS